MMRKLVIAAALAGMLLAAAPARPTCVMREVVGMDVKGKHVGVSVAECHPPPMEGP
jgi:hypothetical protein